MNTTFPSLAARVHQYAGAAQFDDPLSVEDQEALFAIALTSSPTEFRAAFADDGHMTVTWTDPDQEYPRSMTLEDMQSRVEEASDGGYDDFDDGLTYDMYRSFPADMVDPYVIRNEKLGRKHTVLGSDEDDAKNLFALYHGYDSWQEMRELAMDGDRNEDWTVERKST